MTNSNPHGSTVGILEQWRQASFILFDLGVMNLLGGAGSAFFYSIPLHALGFRYSSFWIGVLFILVGLACWNARRLPIAVPIVIIAVDLWNTIRLIPQYELASGVVLVQISFVLPLVLMLISMLRSRLKAGGVNHYINPCDVRIGNGREGFALLSSMFISVGSGLVALLLFARYAMPAITESVNPIINIFHDLFLVPALLILFPLGAALGEFIWMRASHFYLTGAEISLFIRYLKQLPLFSNLTARWLNQDWAAQSATDSFQIHLPENAIGYGPPLRDETVRRKRLWLDGGQGSINDCKIFNNYLGIEIKGNSTASVQDCRIEGNHHEGLVADSTSAGSITGSELAGNSGGAWRIEDGSRLVRNGNTE